MIAIEIQTQQACSPSPRFKEHFADYQLNLTESKSILSGTDKERDLGVVMDPNLNFTAHIDQIICTANRQLGIIKRSFVIRDMKSLVLLYQATVRPILEYASPVWCPWKIKDIDRIECNAGSLK